MNKKVANLTVINHDLGFEDVVYVIRNKQNGLSYVGSARDLKMRINQHMVCSRKRRNSPLHKDIAAFGVDNFECEILEKSIGGPALLEREAFWTEKLNTLIPNGYNKYMASKRRSDFTEDHTRSFSDNLCDNQLRREFPKMKVTITMDAGQEEKAWALRRFSNKSATTLSGFLRQILEDYFNRPDVKKDLKQAYAKWKEELP